jgi:pilus assembly protein CpaB
VLVATQDIPARAVISADFLTVVRRSTAEVDSDAISAPKDVVGKFALVSIPAGSLITASKLTSTATLPAKLAIGMRAVSISIDNVKGVAGLINPGDRVDVIAVPPRVGDETPHGYAILRGALIVALGSDVQTSSANPNLLGGAPALTTVTLALTPAQVDLLAGADMNTVLRLALRNPREPIRAFPAETLKLAPVASIPTNASPPLTVPLPPAAETSPAGPTSTSGRPAIGSPSGVTVIDGDRVVSGSEPR